MTEDLDPTVFSDPDMIAAYVAGFKRAKSGNETPFEWHCEDHPDQPMGHAGCTGCGIPSDTALSFCSNQLKHARQALKEFREQEMLYGLTAVKSRIRELEAALEPFADIDTEGCEDLPEETRVVILIGQRRTDYTTRLIHFRRARAAIRKGTP